MPTASVSGARLWVKASPRGTRSGFAVLPDGAGGRVTVTVLPKPWSVVPTVAREYSHAPGSTTHVVVHELEFVALNSSASAVGSLAMSLSDLVRDQADLLELAAPPKRALVADAVLGDPFRELVDLMLLAERGSLAESRLEFEGAFAPSLLRLLTHERLLQIVESLIFRARPRYAERTETLEMPRGRLGERSLLFSQATGTPRVESTFDELTMDTPLLQVIASALRVVASDRLPRKIAVLRPGLQTRAVHLLRYLSGVSLIDRERAVLVADRLWVSQLDQIWTPALDAALPVLRDRAIVPDDGTEMSDAVLIHVSTEKFWEQCLEVALESAFASLAVSRDAAPAAGVSVPAPWVPQTRTGEVPPDLVTEAFPDFMFRSSRRVVIADAKYKLGGGKAPSSQDGYQLFAYSHLATLDGMRSDFGLVLYPLRAGAGPSQIALERQRDRSYPLWLVRLPFPTRRDLQSQGNWSAYVAGLASEIRAFSVDWTVGEGESTATAS
ncbi:MAG: 5-methylcytosine restriction system specificity protein McrC [Microbacteriaceae bacterium]